jgi:hypothetical protein
MMFRRQASGLFSQKNFPGSGSLSLERDRVAGHRSRGSGVHGRTHGSTAAG